VAGRTVQGYNGRELMPARLCPNELLMPALRSRPPFGNLSRTALLLLVATWGCGAGATESTPPKSPKPEPAAYFVIVGSPAASGYPRSAAGYFSVRAYTARGEPAMHVLVHFSAESGRSGYEFAPFDTATTNADGEAHVGVTYSYLAGTDRLVASADGAVPAKVDIDVIPEWPDHVEVKPAGIHLFGAGDSATFQAVVVDRWLNPVPNAPLDLRVSDSTLVSFTPPTTLLGKGTVRALKGAGTATITSAATTIGALSVTVFPNPRNVCAGSGTQQNLVTSVPVAVTDSVICFPANPMGSAYALMVYNQSNDGATSLGTTLTGYNVVPDMLPPLSADRMRPSLARAPTLIRSSSAPKLDLRFHERLLTRSRSLRRLFAPARAARSSGRTAPVGRIRGPSYALAGSAPSVPAVDSLIALNVADDPCTIADTRTFRVEAIGTRAIVLADTTNPGGGFTRADYERFAARFDMLVYPLDVGNFDAPTDIDGNGHVAILFTRAVNELTPPNSGAFIGGFFHPRDLFPRTQSASFGICPTSNEGEMFYMMVPDPIGTVNGNRFRRGFVDTLTTSVLAHEFQHLINAGRRMYVNTSATDFEDTWLNEGLSHIAEELLYFQESGFTPRSRLTSSSINDTWPHFAPWVSDDASNFERFFLYLSDPANHSPLDANDDLETRGATWAFLRYAVDKGFTSDLGVWQRFSNSTTTGMGTLTLALQRDPTQLLKDFALANMMGGHPSWDFADVYNNVFVNVSYPLPYGVLKDGTAVPAAARGASASYWKFAIPPDAQAMLKIGAGGTPPDGNLKFVLVRTALGP
jgi:hypothetical protein